MANSYCIPPKDNSLQSTKEFTDGIFEIDKDESNDFDNLMIKRSEENYESLNHNESNLSIDNNNSNFDENKNPNFFLIEPPDSSAARMPLGLMRRLAAMSSRFWLEELVLARCLSFARDNVESSLAFSTSMRAILRQVSRENPNAMPPKMVAEAVV
jgi:hypothetical protein